MTKKSNNNNIFDFKAQLLLGNGIDISTRTIMFTEDVSHNAYKKLTKALKLLKTISNEGVTIQLTTGGGDVFAMLAIMDALLNSNIVITMYALGEVASAGIPIYACGDIRVSGQFTRFMVHPMSYGVTHGKVADHKVELGQINSIERQVNQFMARQTNKTYPWWHSAGKQTDLYLTAQETLDIGLSHIVTDPSNKEDHGDGL